jgi:hypothetical protein
MVAGAVGTVLLLLDISLPARVAGASLLGLAAGIPFAAAFAGAQVIRRDSPGAAIGFINSRATLLTRSSVSAVEQPRQALIAKLNA